MPKIQLLKNSSFLLALVISAFILRGTFMASLLPIFQGPDEPVHYATIQYLAEPKEKNWAIENIRKYSVDENKIDTFHYSEELKKTAGYLRFDETKARSKNAQEFSIGPLGLHENDLKNENLKKYIDIYPPVVVGGSNYYHQMVSFLAEKPFSENDIFFRFFLARLTSVFLGSLVILFSFLTFKKIGFSSKVTVLLAAIISFQPMFGATSAIVNYDSLLFLGFSVFTFGAVSILQGGLGQKSIFFLISGFAISFLAKGTGMVLGPVLCLLLLYGIYKKFGFDKKRFIFYSTISMFVLAFIILISPIGGRVLEFVGVGSGNSHFSSEWASLAKYLDKTFREGKFIFTSVSYWGNFGWLDIGVPERLVRIIWAVDTVAVIGIIRLFISKKKRDWLPEKKYLVFFIMMLLFLQSGIRFFDWRVFDGSGKLGIGGPGRYFMPNIAAHFILLFSGLGMFLKKKESFEKLLSVGLVLMAILWFYCVFNLIIPRFYL